MSEHYPALAAGGSATPVTVSGSNLTWVVIVAVIALSALAVAGWLVREVLAASQGTAKMQEIAKAVQDGAAAYLRRQFRTLSVFVFLIFWILLLLPADGSGVRWGRSIFFLVGALFSGLTGFTGMSLCVRGNVRVAAAARDSGERSAMRIAFRTGGVAGMFTVGLGLFGAAIVVLIYKANAPDVLEGFGFGGSLLALFLRVGGGIFTKAADVGADLVGKVEAGIPEDDPRNPATIADNVGDNVGDCAGMAADLFESYEVTLVASIILGVPAFAAIFPHRPALWAAGALFPLGARAIGVLASIVGVFSVRATDKDKSAMAPINRGFLTAGILTILGTLVFALVYVGNPKGGTISNVGWRMFGAVVGGLVLAQIASRITEYFTSTETKPVQE
ncbi:MAG: sodium/proton-translocating pyrophosphatase, partial [Trebonia sp.]